LKDFLGKMQQIHMPEIDAVGMNSNEGHNRRNGRIPAVFENGSIDSKEGKNAKTQIYQSQSPGIHKETSPLENKSRNYQSHAQCEIQIFILPKMAAEMGKMV
jgi:hypothetical protein